jgi:DNA-binding NtrC family response regulator
VLQPSELPIGVRAAPTRENGAPTTRLTLAEAERRYIRQVLGECNGHRQKAARILGISERNLYRKLKELEAEAPC